MADVDDLADGEWHRLHPLTPLLRGGLVMIAIAGFVFANLRERILELLIPGDYAPDGDYDPIQLILERNLVAVALAVVLGIVLLVIAIGWLSWRMHSFRIGAESVEVRRGILFRTHRQARLDRIQGINIVRPLIPRLVGAARLEITVAGDDANIQLAYLGSAVADALRARILQLASGAQRRPVDGVAGAAARATADPASPAAPGAPSDPAAPLVLDSVVGRRVGEFLAPELDPALAAPESVVRMDPGRLVASTVLSTSTLMFVVFLVIAGVLVSVGGAPVALFGVVPLVFGLGSFLVRRIVTSLRYTIAATPDGVRVGFGLLSTSNETLPPGRIHAVSISQELLWRPFDWWQVRINRAGRSTRNGAAGRQNTTVLPIGTRDDVLRVLELLLPDTLGEHNRDLVAAGLKRAAQDDGYTVSPRRAAVLRWFSWRRNGVALHRDAIALRRGAIWRELVIVPTARMQSAAVHQGPLLRALRLAALRVHTVAGPVSAHVGALDVRDAERVFDDTAAAAIAAASTDHSHRWAGHSGRSAGEAPRAGAAPPAGEAPPTGNAPPGGSARPPADPEPA
ncbi:MAG: PH domain-containing protein [Actinomycetales bacterium]|nr:PH domain-containing protein [Actinomycetales bacterium]